MQSIPDPRDSIITDSSIRDFDSKEAIASSAVTVEEPVELAGADPVRNKKRELSMAKVHQKTQQNKSSFNQKGNRFVPKKCGRRGK